MMTFATLLGCGGLEALCDVKERMKLFGHRYFLDVPGRKRLAEGSHEGVLIQHQMTDTNMLKSGRGRFRLLFNHPVRAVYFHGPALDPSKITRVALYTVRKKRNEEAQGQTKDNTGSDGRTKTDFAFFDDHPSLLAYKHAAIYGRAPNAAPSVGSPGDPLFIHFGPDPLDVFSASTLNFSRIDYPCLEIETHQDCGPDGIPFDVVGLHVQGVRITQGMQGLVFSK